MPINGRGISRRKYLSL
jgi:hypothetical protein